MARGQGHGKPLSIEDIAVKTIKGDVRQFMVDRMRAQPKLFTSLSEKDQKAEIGFADDIADQLVRRVVGLVVGHEFPSVAVMMTGQFGVKDGLVTIKSTCPATPENLTSIARDGEAVLSLIDHKTFMGQRAPTKADKDQPDILDEAETPEEKAKREQLEADLKAEDEEVRKRAEAELRKAFLEKARQAGWDAYGLKAGNIPPSEFFEDEDAAKAFTESYEAHQAQAEGGHKPPKGHRGPKRGGEPPEPPAEGDASEPEA